MSCGTRFSWLLSDQNEGLGVGWSWPVTWQRGAPLGFGGFLPPCHKRVVSRVHRDELEDLATPLHPSRKANLTPGGEASYREGLRQVWQPFFFPQVGSQPAETELRVKPELNEGFKTAARLQWNRPTAEHQPDSGAETRKYNTPGGLGWVYRHATRTWEWARDTHSRGPTTRAKNVATP